MPLSVSFNWRAPNAQVSNQAQRDMVEGVKAIGQGIAQARDRRFQREQVDRRNRIEDKDRQRRMAEEDRRKKIYGEAAGLMKDNPTLATLESQRAEIVKKISDLETELGVNG